MIPCVYGGDPVRDAEMHQYFLEEARKKRDYMLCDICQGEIFRADDENYGDDYYKINGMTICDECIQQYLKEIKKEYV